LVFTTVLYSEAEEKQNMFQRGETIMRIGSLICMIMAVYSGHKMISGNKRTRKQVENTKAEE